MFRPCKLAVTGLNKLGVPASLHKVVRLMPRCPRSFCIRYLEEASQTHEQLSEDFRQGKQGLEDAVVLVHFSALASAPHRSLTEACSGCLTAVSHSCGKPGAGSTCLSPGTSRGLIEDSESWKAR